MPHALLTFTAFAFGQVTTLLSRLKNSFVVPVGIVSIHLNLFPNCCLHLGAVFSPAFAFDRSQSVSTFTFSSLHPGLIRDSKPKQTQPINRSLLLLLHDLAPRRTVVSRPSSTLHLFPTLISVLVPIQYTHYLELSGSTELLETYFRTCFTFSIWWPLYETQDHERSPHGLTHLSLFRRSSSCDRNFRPSVLVGSCRIELDDKLGSGMTSFLDTRRWPSTSFLPDFL